MSKALFDYSVRESPKARNIRLRVTWQRGLEIIIPRGYYRGRIPTLLQRKHEWVRAALERTNSHRKFFEPAPRWQPPTVIKLPALGETWQVELFPAAPSLGRRERTDRDAVSVRIPE